MAGSQAHGARGDASSSQSLSRSQPRASSPGQRWCAGAGVPPPRPCRSPPARDSAPPSQSQCRESPQRASPPASHSGWRDRSSSRCALQGSPPSVDQPRRCAPPRHRRTPHGGSSPRRRAAPRACRHAHGIWRDRGWRHCAGTAGRRGGAGWHRVDTSPTCAP